MNCETSQSGECVLRLGCRLPPVPEVAGFRLAFITSDTKHVQTELNEDEYERFREFASEHGLAQGSRPRGAHRVDRTPAATDPDDRRSPSSTTSRASRSRRRRRQTLGKKTTSPTSGTGAPRRFRAEPRQPEPEPNDDLPASPAAHRGGRATACRNRISRRAIRRAFYP